MATPDRGRAIGSEKGPKALTKDDITVIVPTLDEAGAIIDVLNELKKNGLQNIIVADGHSKDETAKLAEGWGARVVQQEGKGKAGAIKTALRLVETDLVLVIDGDSTYEVSPIDRMLELAVESDEVICSRREGRNNISRLNRLGNRVIGWLFNTLFGTHLNDVLSGMYLVKTRLLKEMWLDYGGFSLEVEVAAHVASTTRRLAEVEGSYRPRIGKPKLKMNHGFYIAKDALELTWRYNPALFIFTIGSVMLIPALFILTWVAYYYLVSGQAHFVWAIIGTTAGGISLVSFSMAIMAIYTKRFEYRMTEKFDKLLKER